MKDLVAIIKRMRAAGAIDEYIANVLFEDLNCCHFEIEMAMREADGNN